MLNLFHMWSEHLIFTLMDTMTYENDNFCMFAALAESEGCVHRRGGELCRSVHVTLGFR